MVKSSIKTKEKDKQIVRTGNEVRERGKGTERKDKGVEGREKMEFGLLGEGGWLMSAFTVIQAKVVFPAGFGSLSSMEWACGCGECFFEIWETVRILRNLDIASILFLAWVSFSSDVFASNERHFCM